MKMPRKEQFGTAQNASQADSLLNNKMCIAAPPETFLDLQAELVQALYNGEGLGGLSRRLADYMNGCVATRDVNRSLMAVEFPGNFDSEQKILLRHYVTAQSGASRRYTDTPRAKLSAPVAVTEVFDGNTLHNLARQLQFGVETAGTLTIARLSVPFSEVEVQMFAYASGLFCVQLAQDKKVADIELRLKGNFVEDLISSHFSDSESVLNRARALDYNIQTTHRVLVAEIENFQQIVHHLRNDQTAIARFKTELVQSIQSCLNQSNKGMVIYSKDEITLLVQQKKAASSISDFKALAENIIEDVASQFKAKMFIGIGSNCTELSDFSRSYMEAKKALEIGEFMITEGQVRSFEQFKIHALFLSTLKPADLYNYAREQLEALLVYDEKHHTDFLKTLQEFLYLRNNVEGTARTLNMSVSGLKYRLQRIEKISGLDLKDYKVCFDLQLALVIMQLFGEYRIREKNK